MGRFFTSHGDFVGFSKLPNIAISFPQAVGRKFFGKYPRVPWIPFCAIKAIEQVIRPDWIVREIGAGNSTLWLSPRVAKLTSLEHKPDWFQMLSGILEKERLDNVDLQFREPAACADFSDVPDASLDLLFIDGADREDCLRNGFSKVKPGGYVYLDNWDFDQFFGNCRDFTKQHADQVQGEQHFIDYVPAQVGVYESLLIHKR